VWEPGTAHGHHARTYGWILGEVVRRITGHSLGWSFAEDLAGPFGLDFFVGLPEAEMARTGLGNSGLLAGLGAVLVALGLAVIQAQIAA
jgi:CubicO group peptidase (beta-lactamase class C family)